MRYIPTLDKVVGNCINHSSVIVVVPVKKTKILLKIHPKDLESLFKNNRRAPTKLQQKALHGALKKQSTTLKLQNKVTKRYLVALGLCKRNKKRGRSCTSHMTGASQWMPKLV